MRKVLLGIAVFCLSSIAPAATTINFDDLTPSVENSVYRIVPAGYDSFVTFGNGTGAGLYVWAEANQWNSGSPAPSIPNVVCSAFATDPKNCVADLTISFAQPVNALSIWMGAFTLRSTEVQVQVFSAGAAPASTLTIVSPQSANSRILVDISSLSGVSDITSIRILNPSQMADPFGVVLDNLTFTGPTVVVPPTDPEEPTVPVAPAVPEPQSVLLTLSGLAGLAYYRRRQR